MCPCQNTDPSKVRHEILLISCSASAFPVAADPVRLDVRHGDLRSVNSVEVFLTQSSCAELEPAN